MTALAFGACDDSEPVSGGESGTVSDDDDGGSSPQTGSSTSGTTTGVTTTTDPSGSPTGNPTTTPTPTTMDPTQGEGSSTGDPTDATSSGCTPGTQGCDCDDDECAGGLMCVADVCVQDVECGIDIYEDNNTEADAADLGMIGDDDDDGMTITGVLEGDDVDWFTYQGEDNALAVVDPTRDLITAGALRMCKFAECNEGTTAVTCPEGTAVAESPAGRAGCCGDDSFEIDLACTDFLVGEDAQVWIRFDQGLTECTQFTLEYHY